MRAAGLLLLLVLPARSVAQASKATRVGFVLGVLGRQARGQEWITRWADDADCILDEDSEAEGGGLRQLDVFCVDDDVVVADDACDADDKPDDTWECLATTVVVDPIEGNDLNDGTAESPLRTLRACITRFGEDHSATRKLPDDDYTQLVCALRDGVYRDEASTPLDGVDHLLVKPLNDGGVVTFDGTDPLWGLEWTKHATLETVVVASAPFMRRPEVIVGGSNLMCANESAIVDGNHDPKAGYGTMSPPCFFWAPEEAWVAGETAFGLNDAVAFYERGEAVDVEGRNLPWFWVDEYRKEIYVDLARAPAEAAGHEGILVRVKNASRQDAFSIGNASHRIHVRDMLFYGTACCGDGPTSEMDSADLRITRSRFLYAPSTGIRLKTTRRTSRGGTPYVNFANNTAEFGEAALFYTVWKSTSGAPRYRRDVVPVTALRLRNLTHCLTSTQVLQGHGQSLTRQLFRLQQLRGAEPVHARQPGPADGGRVQHFIIQRRQGRALQLGAGPPLPPQPRHRLCGNQNFTARSS